jgi:hypothetical protein
MQAGLGKQLVEALLDGMAPLEPGGLTLAQTGGIEGQGDTRVGGEARQHGAQGACRNVELPGLPFDHRHLALCCKGLGSRNESDGHQAKYGATQYPGGDTAGGAGRRAGLGLKAIRHGFHLSRLGGSTRGPKQTPQQCTCR